MRYHGENSDWGSPVQRSLCILSDWWPLCQTCSAWTHSSLSRHSFLLRSLLTFACYGGNRYKPFVWLVCRSVMLSCVMTCWVLEGGGLTVTLIVPALQSIICLCASGLCVCMCLVCKPLYIFHTTVSLQAQKQQLDHYGSPSHSSCLRACGSLWLLALIMTRLRRPWEFRQLLLFCPGFSCSHSVVQARVAVRRVTGLACPYGPLPHAPRCTVGAARRWRVSPGLTFGYFVG